MKRITLKFGDRVPVEAPPRSCVQLVIHRMHGDDEFNDTEDFIAPLDKPELMARMIIFTLLAEMCRGNSVHEDCPLYLANRTGRGAYRNDVATYKEKIKAFLISQLGDVTDEGVDLAIEFMESMIGTDKSCEGCGVFAQVTKVDLFIYDEKGAKFFATLDRS